MKWWKLF